jgi:EAL domain-containing protein (putative c-di-GMP-specific phosphodiesterase class I)
MASQDELWIALTDVPAAVAELAARRIHAVLSQPYPRNPSCDGGDNVRLHPCVGIAHAPVQSGDPGRNLLALAYDAARRAGETFGRILVATPSPAASQIEIHRRCAEIRSAIQTNDLDVFFQPQVRLADGRCIGAEALIRWPDWRSGSVTPVEIVSVAESDGLMLPLTMFVLNNSLRHLAEWRGRGFDMRVSVNLSARSLSDPSLPLLIRGALDTWDIDGSSLTLELTEHLIVSNEASALRFMQELRAMGIELALDDFGTGYSSLAYLSRFPVTELKIDQSFVRPLGSGSEDLRVVSAMLGLARTFGLRPVAEGVENETVASALRSLDCAFGQGYHFARPMSAASTLRWLEERCAGVGQGREALRA